MTDIDAARCRLILIQVNSWNTIL